jgi:hypothetical protein
MNVGANDKKKVIFLAILGVPALYLVYTNLLSNPAPPPTVSRNVEVASPALDSQPASPSAAVTAPNIKRASGQIPGTGARKAGEEWHPVYLAKRVEDRPDPSTVDPVLRLDLLAKVQKESSAGTARDLFRYSQAPPPPVTEAKNAGPQVAIFRPIGPRQPPPPAQQVAKVEPPPPPFPGKYYGFSTQRNTGRKTAFFLNGEDIIPALEGDTVMKHYRVVTIGVSSVLLEDTDSKRQERVPLTQENQA